LNNRTEALDTVGHHMTEPGVRRIGWLNGTGLYTLYIKEVRRYIKVWTQTVMAPVVTTVLFMAIFTWALGSGRAPAGVSLGAFLAPGLLAMAIIQNAYQNPVSSILIAKVSGSIADVLMPPLSALELTIGFAAGGITRGLNVGLVLWLAFYFWPGVDVSPDHLWAVIYYTVSAAMLLSLIGILTGVWAEKFDHGAAINNFIIVPFSLLSGTFYTIDRLPGALQTVSQFNPFFYLIDGLRYGFIGRSDGDIFVGTIAILVLNLVLLVIVHRVLKSGYRLKA